MYYRAILINKRSGERECSPTSHKSKKSAVKFADEWTKNIKDSAVEIYKDDMKTLVYSTEV